MNFEEKRLEALARFNISPLPEPEFDLLTKVAAELCNAPYAFISIVDRDKVWTKSAFGSENLITKRDEDLCNYSIQEETGLMIDDLRVHTISKNLPIAAAGSRFRCYLGANLKTSDGFSIGGLCILDDHPREMSVTHLQILAQLAKQVMALFELKIKTEELAKAYQTMEKLATFDSLTGLYGRRAFIDLLERNKAEMNDESELYLVFVDLDFFKRINDDHGHDAGDAVLRTIGEVLIKAVLNRGYAGRFGGEEFCLVIFDSNKKEMEVFTERLRNEIANQNVPIANSTLKVTASLGVAWTTGRNPQTCVQLIKKADIAVYKAKETGRNCVVFMD